MEESPQRSRGWSQFIASFLERVCYILLIPALPAALFGIFALLTIDGLGTPVDPAAVARGQWRDATTVLVILLIGLVLLWGYRHHARGRNGWVGSLLLWLGTVLYNGAFLGWSLRDGIGPLLSEPSLLSALLLLWWLTAIVLALVAAALDVRARPATATNT